MLFSLDYDNTYTLDPKFWDNFIESVKHHGHQVVCITMRYPDKPEETIYNMPCKVYYTGRKAKKPFANDLGLYIDVWIDDMPYFVENDASS